MKSGLVWVLFLSLVANGALLAARWRASPPAASSHDAGVAALPGPEVAPPNELESGAATTADRITAAAPVAEGGRPAPPGSLWASLDMSDLKSVVATLLEAGMPESDMRTIVQALVRDRFKARFEAVEVADAQQPFWQPRLVGSPVSRRFSESNAIWREVEALMTEVLGSPPLEPQVVRSLRQQYGPFSEEKLQALMRLERDYSDLSMQARTSGFGPTMPWESEQLAFIEAEKRRDIEATLGPGDLEMYDLHTSGTAHNLRRQLAGFSPTEAEFRAIFAIQSEFDRTYNVNQSGSTSADWNASEQAKPKLHEQLKASLGEERFRDYERSIDSGYQTALAVTKRLNLPAGNANAAYALAEETQAGIKALNAVKDLASGERAAAIAKLVDEANAQLDSLLTTSGAAAYKVRSSQWRQVESGRRPR